MGRGFLGFGQDYSYKPPEASYTAQGPHEQQTILEVKLFTSYNMSLHIPLYSLFRELKTRISRAPLFSAEFPYFPLKAPFQ